MVNPYKNRNVQLILFGGSLHALSNSILWVLTTFLIYGLGGSNSDLGWILGTANIAGITIGFLASFLADRTRKDLILILSLLIEIIGVFILSIGTTLDMIFIGQILVSSGSTAVYPVITAYFSLSIPSNKKNRVFGTNFLFNNIASAAGGVISYFILRSENLDSITTLNLDILREVIRISMYILILTTLFSFLLSEKYILSELDEIGTYTELKTIQNTKSYHTIINPGYFEKHTLTIILLSLLSSYIIGLGAGISIPYFPRFFFDIYKIDLANLNLLFSAMIVFTAIWGKINANLADRWGRNQLIAINQMVSVLLLFLLSSIPPFSLAFLALFVRNAAMNGTGPLFNTIQMDYSPRRYRSLVNAVNSIAWGLFFSLGQIFGGRLVDYFGFSIPFIITATLYFLATLPFFKIKNLEVLVTKLRDQSQ